MTHTERADLDARILRLVEASIQDSWKGHKDPVDVPEIERELKEAETSLTGFLDRLTAVG